MNKKRLWLWILPLIWMCIIFGLSHQAADESSDLSGNFLRIVDRFLGLLGLDIDEGVLHSLVRKTAHFLLYFVLACLLYIAAYFNVRSRIKTIVISGLVSIAYAITDEIHQYFVPGRSCELRDVLIDTSGAVLAILCCLAIGALYRAKRKEKGKDLA
ncbi:MAG: VanZ family protein [Bacillota bacterium]|nr:VanZ family protein [Bacillota bacterium]